MKSLGEEGYIEMARKLMEATATMKEAVRNIEGLKVLGNPHMTCFAFAASDPNIDIQAVADVMETKGHYFYN